MAQLFTRWLVFGLALLCLFYGQAGSAFAQDYPQFSVDLPGGWEIVSVESRPRVTIADFAFSGSQTRVVLSIMELGPFARKRHLFTVAQKQIREDYHDMRLVQESDAQRIYEGTAFGSPERDIFIFDEAQHTYVMVKLMGDLEEATRCIRGISMKKPAVSLLE